MAMQRIASNVTVEQIRHMDENGLIERNFIDAPAKDTVPVPDGGYTIVRFLATNPGINIETKEKKSSYQKCTS